MAQRGHMTNWQSLHPIQIGILHALTFRTSARFSELKAPHVTSDRFSFHLKKLQEMELIEHVRATYRLTDLGKSIAGQISSPENDDTGRQARVGVLIGCVRINNKTDQTEFLLQQRLKHPFYGCVGFMASKVRWGETVEQAAARGLMHEQGLAAQLELVGIKHKMDSNDKKILLEDKYFFVFRGRNPEGKLLELCEGGKNFWATKDEIARLSNKYEGVTETLAMIDNTGLTFVENQFTISNY